MGNVIIRAATSGDIPGICHVNRGEDGPWAEIDSCAAYVMNRLRCGFYVQVAEYGGRIAAHGEWVVSDEYRGRTFYLGQLQVDPDLQRRGIGHLMIEDGVAHARAAGCGTVTLIPEQDTHSQLFYEKCGFVRGEDLLFSSLPAREGALRGERLSEAPHELVRTMPFVFGLCQTAAQHMWQVFNRRPDGEGRQVDTLMGDGFCIQLGGFDKQKTRCCSHGRRTEKPEKRSFRRGRSRMRWAIRACRSSFSRQTGASSLKMRSRLTITR